MKTRECLNCNAAIELEFCPGMGTYYYHIREDPFGSIFCNDGALGTMADPKEHEYYALDYEDWKLEHDQG